MALLLGEGGTQQQNRLYSTQIFKKSKLLTKLKGALLKQSNQKTGKLRVPKAHPADSWTVPELSLMRLKLSVYPFNMIVQDLV